MTTALRGVIERKDDAPNTPEIKAQIDRINDLVVKMRETHEKNLAEIKAGQGDVVRVDEVKRLDAAIEAQSKALNEALAAMKRAPAGEQMKAGTSAEVKAAHAHYWRTGEDLGLKTASVGVDPSGGYTVYPEMEQTIDRTLSEISPIRQIARVIPIGTDRYKRMTSVGRASSGWVGEQSARPGTAEPTLTMQEFPVHEIYAMPAVTQQLIEDSSINIEQWLSSEVVDEFALQEGGAFVEGNGVARPRGFLSYNNVANASWSWGNIGYVASGVAASLGDDPIDPLIDLLYSVKAGYRASARFVMNRATLAVLRKVKDADGNYIWQPPAANGIQSSILGYPITEAEDMPDIGANLFPIAFGDFSRGYLIIDRIGISVTRDIYTSKPNVLLYTRKRVGGGVANFEAIKLLKIAAS